MPSPTYRPLPNAPGDTLFSAPTTPYSADFLHRSDSEATQYYTGYTRSSMRRPPLPSPPVAQMDGHGINTVRAQQSQQQPIAPADRAGNRHSVASTRSGTRTDRRPEPLSFDNADTTRNYGGPDSGADDGAFNATLLYHPEQKNESDSSRDPSKSPPTTFTPLDSQFARPTRKRRLLRGFEEPHWWGLGIHLVSCVLAWPILYIFTLIAHNKSLFWVRLVIAIGCGGIGFALGISLLTLGKRFLEAATWATLIHQSRVPAAAGMRLNDLATASNDPMSAYIALRLLWNRHMYPGTARKQRKSYDSRPWSVFIMFFLLIAAVAASGPFLLGRIVNITSMVSHQYEEYTEVAIKGDLSLNDIEHGTSLEAAFNDFRLTWTISPFSSHGGLPAPVALPWIQDGINDTVYFSETISSQLSANGSGFGTFQTSSSASAAVDGYTTSQTVGKTDVTKPIDPGNVLRFPRWGIRIHCAAVPNLEKNIVPRSTNGFTYVFTERTVINDLFKSFQLPLPEKLNQPLNTTATLMLNDTMPRGVDPADIALASVFYDNGVAQNFKSHPQLAMGADGSGIVTLEHVVVRINDSYTTHGSFGRLSDATVLDANNVTTHIGYDAAVCLELYEPWITELLSPSIGVPSTVKIVAKGTDMAANYSDMALTKLKGQQLQDVNRLLNSSKLASVYDVAHGNSINQMIKDNGRDAFYVPSPTLVSYTDGDGPYGYTKLDPQRFAQSRALSDATNVLSYFAGSRDLVARSFADRSLSNAEIGKVYMGIFIVAYFVLGVLCAFFVPTLPGDIPRRNFDIYSWLAAFNANELVLDDAPTHVPKQMELEDIKKRFGDMRFRYVI